MISKLAMIERFRKYVRNYRFNLWILEGKERSSGENLKIVYAGHLANKNYICHLAYAGEFKETDYGIIWLWTALKLHARYSDAHLVILEINEKIYRRFSGNAGVYIPCWIDGELEFSEAKKRYKTSENLKSDLRKIRKNNLKYEVTRDRKLFDHFYYEMYVPHVTRVHDDRALLMSHHAMISNMDKCDLLLIKMGDEYIAGELLIYEGNTVRAWSLGVKHGDMSFVKAGVVAAFYHYRTSYLEEKGYKSVRMGASRAFLKDGVLQYKKKWGTRLVGPRPAGFAIRPVSMTKGVMDFLVHNPFIFGHHGMLEGAIFINHELPLSEDQITKLYRDYYIEGLSSINLYLGKDGGSLIKIPDELSGKIVIKSVESFLKERLID